MTDADVRSSTLSVTIVAQYETLRSAMLGEALAPVARSGLIVFLRHGMWEWARTLTPGALGLQRGCGTRWHRGVECDPLGPRLACRGSCNGFAARR